MVVYRPGGNDTTQVLSRSIRRSVAEVSGPGRVYVEGMTCRRIPKSGRTAADVLKHVGLSTDEIVAQAKAPA